MHGRSWIVVVLILSLIFGTTGRVLGKSDLAPIPGWVLLGSHMPWASGLEIADSHSAQKTLYIPLPYLIQALDHLDIHSDLQGNTWRIDIPDYLQSLSDLRLTSHTSGSLEILVGMNLIASTNDWIMPASFKGQETVYIPLDTARFVLSEIGVQTTWNGTVLDLQHGRAPTSTSSGSVSTSSNSDASVSPLWSQYVGPDNSSLALAGSTAVIVNYDTGTMTAYDALTGTPLWQNGVRSDTVPYTVSLAASYTVVLYSPIDVPGDLQSNFTVYALSAFTGRTLWSVTFHSPIVSMQADGSTVWVVTQSGGLVALQAQTGKRLWLYKPPVSISALLTGTHQVLIGTTGGQLFCVSAQGKLLWARRISQSAVSGLASPDVQRVVAVTGSSLQALTSNGLPLWRTALSGQPVGGNVAVDLQSAYAIVRHVIVCVDLRTGRVRKQVSVPSGEHVVYTPLVTDGRLWLVMTGYKTGIDAIETDTLQPADVTETAVTGGEPILFDDTLLVETDAMNGTQSTHITAFQ